MVNQLNTSTRRSLLRIIPISAPTTFLGAKRVKAVKILGSFSMKNFAHKQLTFLAGLVAALDIFSFLILQGAGFQLDFIHITSYLLACNLGYIVSAATTTSPLSYFSPSAILGYHAILLPGLLFRSAVVAYIATWQPGKGLLIPLAVPCYSLLASTIGYLIVSSKINGKNQPLNWRLTSLLVIFHIILLYALIKPQTPLPPKPDFKSGGT